MRRMKVAEQLPRLVDPHGETKLGQVLDRIAAPTSLRRREQTDQRAFRGKSLRRPARESTG